MMLVKRVLAIFRVPAEGEKMKSGSFWKFPFQVKWKEMDKGRFIKSEIRLLGIWLIDWDIRPFWYYEELS